jgi:hypothetical protein
MEMEFTTPVHNTETNYISHARPEGHTIYI